MKHVTILAQAVGAWLQYEFACSRANLFNERYLSVAIADALYAMHKDEVRSEYLHPVLAPHKTVDKKVRGLKSFFFAVVTWLDTEDLPNGSTTSVNYGGRYKFNLICNAHY
jgi:hypothetical protein